MKLTFPNGAESLIAGTDTTITWTNIPESDTVKLDYSIDFGKT